MDKIMKKQAINTFKKIRNSIKYKQKGEKVAIFFEKPFNCKESAQKSNFTVATGKVIHWLTNDIPRTNDFIESSGKWSKKLINSKPNPYS